LLHLLAWLFICIFLAVLVGMAYQAIGTRRDHHRFPTPGRLVDIGGHRLHIFESGARNSGPTVLLEAGLMSTVLSWTVLQRQLSRNHHVVSYDRAGLGWSDAGPMPRSSDRIVDELHTLLRRAAVPPPYVLVGHSFGGLTMPLFAARFPREVVGMVLVDPVAPVEWNPPSDHDREQVRIGAAICRRAALLSRIGLIRFVAFLLSTPAKTLAARLVRLVSRGSPAESGTVSSPWFFALPDAERAMAAVFWIQPKFALTIASQLEHLPANAGRLAALNHIPEQSVVILSARTAPEHRRKEHAAMAARLPRGTHILAEKSNHWIMQEQPELVLQAIESVLQTGELSRVAAAGSSASL
jgi:pimeloyl-ACP methyl ester carboxylesterase